MARKLAALAHVIRKTGAEQRAIQTVGPGHLYTPAIERCALSALGGEEFVAHGIVNHAEFQLPLVLQPHRDTKARISVRVIRGAIQRVDDPAPFTLRLRIRRAGARFFRED